MPEWPATTAVTSPRATRVRGRFGCNPAPRRRPEMLPRFSPAAHSAAPARSPCPGSVLPGRRGSAVRNLRGEARCRRRHFSLCARRRPSRAFSIKLAQGTAAQAWIEGSCCDSSASRHRQSRIPMPTRSFAHRDRRAAFQVDMYGEPERIRPSGIAPSRFRRPSVARSMTPTPNSSDDRTPAPWRERKPPSAATGAQ